MSVLSVLGIVTSAVLHRLSSSIFHFQNMCILTSKVSLLQITYNWILLFFNPFCQQTSFESGVYYIYI